MPLFHMCRLLFYGTENTKYSAVLVYTYKLKSVMSTTLYELGLYVFCILYVSVGRGHILYASVGRGQ